MITAIPFPQHVIESGGAKAEGLISISGHGYPQPVFDAAHYSNRVLRLVFDDIPAAEWTDHNGKDWIGPTEAQIEEVLAFTAAIDRDSRWGGTIAVHCLHGQSRSFALAVAINAQSRGPGQELAAVTAALRGSAIASRKSMDEVLENLSGNPGIIRAADRLLQRSGAIEAAMDHSVPRFRSWKTYWQRNGCLV